MDAFELGAAIRAARKSQKLTQAELARQVGVSRHTIMQLEANTYSDLGVRKILSILSVLGLSIDVAVPQRRWPTLEDVYEENEQERRAREARFRRSR